MKGDYDRHHKKCARQVKETQREKTKALAEVTELSEQLTRLNEKLEASFTFSFHFRFQCPASNLTFSVILRQVSLSMSFHFVG